ncbi:MAG: PEP-CTERM sorting domain-containing protein, partial [Planctomycetota bacterium]
GIILGISAATFAGQFAGSVVSYDSGTTPAEDWFTSASFDDPNSALGEPTNVIIDMFGTNLMSPFTPGSQIAQIVSVGEGGHLTLKLDNYVVVGPGLDIGVITNVGLLDIAWPTGQCGNPAQVFGDDPATVEVSANGADWVSLGAVTFNMPANYYANATAYNVDPPAGPQVADFGKPFDPAGGLSAFDGLNFAGVLGVLDGSGGGTWLDLSPTGLTQVGYVRFSVADDGDPNNDANFEVDAVVIANGKVGDPVGAEPVPEPAAISLLALAGGLRLIRRRRT